MRIRYWPFIQISFSGSKTAGALLTSARSNHCVASPAVKSSRFSPGDQPRSVRKLKSASGTMPISRYSSAEVAPVLFDSRFLSPPRISGRCANDGTAAPKARKSRTCFGNPTYHLSLVVDDIDMALTHLGPSDALLSHTSTHGPRFRALR